ncbi:hypothetical protein [Microvirgula aerodenitrificans]|uniref:hypothetical protein n=1 Tax=Microvirgula aerodenitrificans TaxID=57480 RepID=UPI00248D50E9|nr:hypothetical protein [Microvirgula aerodenitrificans]
MLQNVVNGVSERFDRNWLLWIAVRHFLPSSFLRELCCSLVNAMSGNKLKLEDIFDEKLTGQDLLAETWLVRPRPLSSPLAFYLKNIILPFVWKNDDQVFQCDDKVRLEAAVDPALLEFAIALGSCDFNNLPRELNFSDVNQIELQSFYQSVARCALFSRGGDNSQELLQYLKTTLLGLPDILVATILKHLGDLFADIDDWNIAVLLYTYSRRYIEPAKKLPEWGEFASLLEVVVIQSEASATAAIHGYTPAADILGVRLTSNELRSDALFVCNSALDEFVASTRGKNSFLTDSRSAVLLPPLLSETHDLSHPLESWASNEFNKAQTWFWSVLRRQTALGLSVASKGTKAYYARCIVDSLSQSKERSPDTFKLSIRLLVESENWGAVDRIEWSDTFIENHLDDNVCDFVIGRAEIYEGCRKYRQSVAIALFKVWSLKASIHKSSAVESMLKYMVNTCSGLSASAYGAGVDRNVCLKAIQEVGKRRPEFRYLIHTDLSELLCATIGKAGFWTGEEALLEVASIFAQNFTLSELTRLTSSVLGLLDSIDPAAEMWTIVRPAMVFLSNEHVKLLTKNEPLLGRRIIETILRFSEGQDTFSTQGIFVLNDFSPEILQDAVVKDRLGSAINDVRTRALTANSSNAVTNILALLIAPRIADREGIQDALVGLEKILQSAVEANPAISFSHAYEPLRYLAKYSQKIIAEASIQSKEMHSHLEALYVQVRDVWHVASHNPSVFAPFSFVGQSSPNPTTVHNWAFASLELAEALTRFDEMKGAIDAASARIELKDAIALAWSTRLANGCEVDDDYSHMSEESRSAFYAALGRRLVAFQRAPSEKLARALLEQVLCHGPRAVDAAVLTLVALVPVQISQELREGLMEYGSRIGGERELQLLLSPLVYGLTSAQHTH